jgi:serine-type D-Ala-D-Ala carboxypeptidase/endopeptidase
MKLVHLLTSALTLAAPICVAASSPLPDDKYIHDMLAARVDLQKKATGIVVGIVTPAGTRVVTYGVPALGDQRQLNGSSVFEIASITKIFTALLLSDMATRGELTLSDPVQKYLPIDQVRVPAYGERQITLFDLASHTSGLPLRPVNLTSQTALNKYAGYTVDQLYRGLSSMSLDRAPGDLFEYSNLGYGLLGHALANRAGTGYETLFQQRITNPLGMHDTRTELTADMRRRLVVGHTDDLTPGIYEGSGALDASGSLHSTANDLLIFLEAFMGKRATPFRAAMTLMMAKTVPAGDATTRIGLGWRITSLDGHQITWSAGRADGFRSFIGFSTATGIGVVALANAGTGAGADDIAQHLIDPHYPVDLQAPVKHEEIKLRTEALERFAGQYRFEDGATLTIRRTDDHLSGQMTGQGAFDLFAESESGFFVRVIGAQITFELPSAGPATALTLHQNGQRSRAPRLP